MTAGTWELSVDDCFGCGRTFTFNPKRVPSVIVDGLGMPLCLRCVRRANPEREAAGIDPIPVLPGAYEAWPDEEELQPAAAQAKGWRARAAQLRARFGSEVYNRPEWPTGWEAF